MSEEDLKKYLKAKWQKESEKDKKSNKKNKKKGAKNECISRPKKRD